MSVSKPEENSLFETLFRKVKMKKWAKAFFECILKPRTAQEIRKLCEIKDVSNAKQHLNEAVYDTPPYLDTWTEKGIRYWYVSDAILKRILCDFLDFKEFKGFKRQGKRAMIQMFDISLKVNPKGLERTRKIIYNVYRENIGKF